MAGRHHSATPARADRYEYAGILRCDNGTSLDGVPVAWNFTPRLRAKRFLDQPFRKCRLGNMFGCARLAVFLP